MRSTTAPYTESRLTRSVANERVGFPVVEQFVCKHDEIIGRVKADVRSICLFDFILIVIMY